MSLKQRLILYFSLILLISGIILTGFVWYETQEQLDILLDMTLTDSQKVTAIEYEIKEILIAITVSIFVIMLLALLVISYVANQFVKPVTLLSEQIELRGFLNLSTIQVSGRSKEIKVIVRRTNDLLLNIADRIEYEKQFTADVAHELRTPLAGLRLNLELTEDLPEKQLLISRIDDLLMTIEHLLQFARANHKLHSSEIAPFNFFEEVIEPLKILYEEDHPHPIIWNIPKDLEVSGDPDLISLLLKNLLDNAAFYAAMSTKTLVSIKKLESHVELIVEDNGLGIDPQRLKEMTQRFHRVDESRNGFGLGLSIVERIVHAHHGRMILKNREDGQKGLRIEILLPY